MNFDGIYAQNHQKRETKVQWLIEEGEQKELYDDLGIIGEISSPEPGSSTLSIAAEHIHKVNKCGLLQNCKQLNFETPSTSTNMDIKLKRALNRMQRKRSRKASKVLGNMNHAKIGRMDINNADNSKYKDCATSTDLSVISKLPDEVFLKIFRYCNSETRVMCSRVCWRWYHIVNDESLWQQVSLARQTTNLYQLQRMLRRDVKVLCLNCATVQQSPTSQDQSNSSFSSMFDDSTSFTSSPRLDPFSRAYHYSVHSLDFTNASVSPNTLCMILMRCNRLQNLSLEGLTISHNVLGSISSCVLLERLNVCLCHEMTTSGLVQLLLSCTKIVELNLGWTNLCQSDPSRIIENLPTDLTRLNISGLRDTLRDSHVITLIKRCQNLIEVDVSDSNFLTGLIVDQMIAGLSRSLRAVNLSRCYSISPNCFLRFSRLPQLRYLDVFGVMDDASIGTLAAALPRVRVCLRPFSAIARPSPSALYGTRRKTVWGYYVA